MPQVIDLEGFPDTVAEAIAETVRNLKNAYLKGGTAVEHSSKLTAAEADRTSGRPPRHASAYAEPLRSKRSVVRASTLRKTILPEWTS